MSLTSLARKVLSTFGATVSAACRISANSFSRLMASFAGFAGTQSAQSPGTISGAIGASCKPPSILLSVEGIQNPHARRPSRPLAGVKPGLTEARKGHAAAAAEQLCGGLWPQYSEERSDEAIHVTAGEKLDWLAPLAMTAERSGRGGLHQLLARLGFDRSEERRVGKEWRSR